MTEDIVGALRFAKEEGSQTVAIMVSNKDNLVVRNGDIVIDYKSNALFIVSLAAVCLVSLEIARLQGADVQKTIDQLIAMRLCSESSIVNHKKGPKNLLFSIRIASFLIFSGLHGEHESSWSFH